MSNEETSIFTLKAKRWMELLIFIDEIDIPKTFINTIKFKERKRKIKLPQ